MPCFVMDSAALSTHYCRDVAVQFVCSIDARCKVEAIPVCIPTTPYPPPNTHFGACKVGGGRLRRGAFLKLHEAAGLPRSGSASDSPTPVQSPGTAVSEGGLVRWV